MCNAKGDWMSRTIPDLATCGDDSTTMIVDKGSMIEWLNAIIELDYEVANLVIEFGTDSPNVQRLRKVRDIFIHIRNEMMEAERNAK